MSFVSISTGKFQCVINISVYDDLLAFHNFFTIQLLCTSTQNVFCLALRREFSHFILENYNFESAFHVNRWSNKNKQV